MSEAPKPRVPYLDLRAQYENIKNELEPAVRAVFENSAYILGGAVGDFERDFAAFCGARSCVAVNNGTSALHLALLAAGIGPGDEVVTQANTFIATVAAILYTGAKPVLVDVAPPSYTIDVDQVAKVITPHTKAIVPVHLYGQPCDLQSIRDLANRRGIPVIEDASQAHGATYFGLPIGCGGTATFSFYPGKNLGAAGEAGAIVTSDESLARRARLLRNHGSERKYVHEALGYNYRMEGLQGAILGVKLRHLASWTAARTRVAAAYDSLLHAVSRPAPLRNTTSAHHVYPVFVTDRDGVAERMRAAGVETNVHYPVPCHLQPGYTSLGYRQGDFPHSEQLAATELSLPIYPEITPEQIGYVCEVLLRESPTTRAGKPVTTA